jgi:hypothetical protein
MKIIYLQDENYNWQQFQYENIDQLKCEFENRKIQIGYDCEIGSGCCLGKRAKVEEKISLLKSIYIMGSNHSVTYVGGGNVSIGSHTHPINTWLQSESIDKNEGYTHDQMEEYRQYILICDAFDKAINK